MCQGDKEKQKRTHDGRNGTIKPRKDQNALGKGNLQILENNGEGHHKKMEMKEKFKSISGGRGNYSKPNYIAEITSKG